MILVYKIVDPYEIRFASGESPDRSKNKIRAAASQTTRVSWLPWDSPRRRSQRSIRHHEDRPPSFFRVATSFLRALHTDSNLLRKMSTLLLIATNAAEIAIRVGRRQPNFCKIEKILQASWCLASLEDPRGLGAVSIPTCRTEARPNTAEKTLRYANFISQELQPSQLQTRTWIRCCPSPAVLLYKNMWYFAESGSVKSETIM